jgi:putative Mg2+ transporter-C (MgtC) family protein
MQFLEIIGWREITLRLCSAVLIGALLGLNRELNGKPAGLRTNALVSLGAALLTLISIGTAMGHDHAPDPGAVSRVMQGIITGIGFLGAGVILRDVGGTRVHGITTAATIWLVAVLGIVCGAGIWPVALVGVVLTLVVLVLGRPLEKYLHRRFPSLAEPPHDPGH